MAAAATGSSAFEASTASLADPVIMLYPIRAIAIRLAPRSTAMIIKAKVQKVAENQSGGLRSHEKWIGQPRPFGGNEGISSAVVETLLEPSCTLFDMEWGTRWTG